jgi:hypothetical protein
MIVFTATEHQLSDHAHLHLRAVHTRARLVLNITPEICIDIND